MSPNDPSFRTEFHTGVRYEEETANTLRYAAQAKKIVNVVIVNENPYVKMIKKVLPISALNSLRNSYNGK